MDGELAGNPPKKLSLTEKHKVFTLAEQRQR